MPASYDLVKDLEHGTQVKKSRQSYNARFCGGDCQGAYAVSDNIPACHETIILFPGPKDFCLIRKAQALAKQTSKNGGKHCTHNDKEISMSPCKYRDIHWYSHRIRLVQANSKISLPTEQQQDENTNMCKPNASCEKKHSVDYKSLI